MNIRFFWPGSEAEVQGIRPGHWLPFTPGGNASVNPFQHRVDTVIDWMTTDEVMPHFVTLYFDSPDSEGHRYGPDSAETATMLEYCDFLIESLLSQLDAHGLLYETDVIITSDHGMANIYPETQTVFLTDYVDKDLFEYVFTGTMYISIVPKEGKGDEIFNALQEKHPNMTVYRKNFNMLERHHYEKNDRIAEILCVADLGWSIQMEKEKSWSIQKGTHGFDNAYREVK